MYKTIVNSDDAEIKEFKFYQYKSPILINYIDINKIAVSNKLPFGKKGFKCFDPKNQTFREFCQNSAKKYIKERLNISIYKRG